MRNQLSADQVEEFSLRIANNVLKLPIWDQTWYHVFLSISEKKKVNTEYLLHILQGRDKSIIVPKTDFATKELKHLLLQENTVLKTSDYGIPEPVSGLTVPEDQIEIVFVPLLAFDVLGNRIGYGGGFYDRFLAKCNPNTRFIGLSFFAPEPALPAEKPDIPMHYCITPEQVYEFGLS